MPLAIPPELKKINPYIRRAEELDKDKTSPESRLVAYYCRQYAVHIGIPLSTSSPAAKVCLGHILGNLETEKPAMDNFTEIEAAYLCRKFANAVFDKADAEDRSGGATKDTAKTFYAAASFLQILGQFYRDDDTSEEVTEDKKRIIYSKWKATEILKAIKEGREPTPGGYGEEMDMQMLQDDDNSLINPDIEKKADAPPSVFTVANDDDDNEISMPLPPIAPSSGFAPLLAPKAPSNHQEKNGSEEEGTEVELGAPPAYPGDPSSSVDNGMNRPKLSFNLPPPVESKPLPTITPREVVSPKSPTTKAQSNLFGFGRKSNTKASKAQLADAAELARFALAALEDKDGDLAAERLQQALKALGR